MRDTVFASRQAWVTGLTWRVNYRGMWRVVLNVARARVLCVCVYVCRTARRITQGCDSIREAAEAIRVRAHAGSAAGAVCALLHALQWRRGVVHVA